MELSCKSCLTKLFLEAFAWNCHAEAAFAKLFLKLLCESVVQKLPFETISLAVVWNCRAKVALCEILFSISRLLRRAFEQAQKSWAQAELSWAQSTQGVHGS